MNSKPTCPATPMLFIVLICIACLISAWALLLILGGERQRKIDLLKIRLHELSIESQIKAEEELRQLSDEANKAQILTLAAAKSALAAPVAKSPGLSKQQPAR